MVETLQSSYANNETTTERGEMTETLTEQKQAEIIEETLADGTVVEPTLVSIQQNHKDGSVTEIPVPEQINLGRKKHSGIKKGQFIEIWNRQDIKSLKEFCQATGLSENCARVRSYQYNKKGEMLKQLLSK